MVVCADVPRLVWIPDVPTVAEASVATETPYVVEEDEVDEVVEGDKEVVFLFIPRILIYFISLLYNYNN